MKKWLIAIMTRAALGALLGYVAYHYLREHPITISLSACLPICVLIAGLAWAGWNVRQLRLRRRAAFGYLGAATVYTFAQACSRMGALLCGVFASVTLAYLTGISTSWIEDQIFATGFLTLCWLFLVIVGGIVEYLCRITPTDGDESASNPNPAPYPSAQ